MLKGAERSQATTPQTNTWHTTNIIHQSLKHFEFAMIVQKDIIRM